MKRAQRQAGIVSLMVTLVMIIVITLIVLGFAEIARNNQRSALDDQLSVQAYYAAESGVNDAITVIDQALAGGGSAPAKSQCDPAEAPYNLNGTVDASHSVAYTCLTVNTSPTTLTSTLGYTSSVLPLISGNGSPFNTLTLNWTADPSLAPITATGCDVVAGQLKLYPPVGSWACDYPIVRVDLLDASGTLTRASWGANTTTLFLVPFNSMAVGNSVNVGAEGTPVSARCNAVGCTASITGLSHTTYYLRLTALYRSNASVNISAGGVPFADAEAIIDSTGKAQDVLRRIQVAVDLTDANTRKIPSAAIISEDSICKRFGVTNGSFNVYDDLSAGAGGNAYCQPQTVGSPTP